MAAAMFTRLSRLRQGDEYEDLDADDNVEMDITDMYRSLGKTPPHIQTKGPGGASPRHVQKPPDNDHIETFTVQECIDQIGFGKFQVKLSVLTGFAWMADAMEMMILSILSPALHCEWRLEGWQEALITTVVFCGMMCSSSIWGSICDKYGRKTELILCSLITCYFGILSSFAPNFIWMLILRGLVGFGIGGAPQSVTLYAEFLPSKARATCVTLVEMFWAIGACFEVLLALFVMPTLGWSYLLGFSAVPLLIFSIFCVWLPESARYDMTRGNYDKALKTLERIARDNGKPMPLGKLVEPHTHHVIKRGRVKDLFMPELKVTTILLWIIWHEAQVPVPHTLAASYAWRVEGTTHNMTSRFASSTCKFDNPGCEPRAGRGVGLLVCAFSYYGIVLLTTAMFENPDGCHGTDVKFNPNPSCFLECKTLTTKDYKDLTWTTFAEFPGLFITAYLLNKIGRKYTMAVEFIIFTIFVMLVNICTTRALLTFFLFVARAFISGAFQGAYVYTPEVYPTSMRALGLGTCSGMARIGAIVTPFVAQVLLKESAYAAISIYGGMCLIASISAFFLPIETKGRDMKDSGQEVTRTKKLSQ